MRWVKLLFALALIKLIEEVELKGGRGGGGGFKLFGAKKSSLKNARIKQQKTAARTSPKVLTENEITKKKYFNRDAPISSKDYGTIFASKGLSSNTYIYNNYYRFHSRQSGIAQFLTNALFLRNGIKIGREMSQYDEWDDDDDKHWRMTTKAPYFENKIPGTRKFLPASAVDGAATAFGLETLLPLNIPPSNPIMYCWNLIELRQKRIRLNDEIYSCQDGNVVMNCDDEICKNITESNDVNSLYYRNGTLFCTTSIFCNDTTDEIIQCYFGQLASDIVAFIPTIKPKIEVSRTGFERIYNYFIELVGLAAPDPTTALPVDMNVQSKWIPQPLEIPPEPTTTPQPHIYLVKSNDNNNKPSWHYYRSLSDLYLRSEKLKVPMSSFERNNVRSFTISEYNNMKANGEVLDF